MQYGTIYADPPWAQRAGNTKGWAGSRVIDHYPVMKVEAICALPVKDMLLPTAHLWMWAVSNLLPDAMAVINAWGFHYVTNLAWGKTSGLGTGIYLRTQHELCLFATRGPKHYPPQINGKRPAIPSLLLAPRGRHSQKPDEMYSIIDKISPGPRLELFARQKREGWHSWGNEVESDVEIAA